MQFLEQNISLSHKTDFSTAAFRKKGQKLQFLNDTGSPLEKWETKRCYANKENNRFEKLEQMYMKVNTNEKDISNIVFVSFRFSVPSFRVFTILNFPISISKRITSHRPYFSYLFRMQCLLFRVITPLVNDAGSCVNFGLKEWIRKKIQADDFSCVHIYFYVVFVSSHSRYIFFWKFP